MSDGVSLIPGVTSVGQSLLSGTFPVASLADYIAAQKTENCVVATTSSLIICDTVNGLNLSSGSQFQYGIPAPGPGVCTHIWFTFNTGAPLSSIVLGIFVDGETTPSICFDFGWFVRLKNSSNAGLGGGQSYNTPHFSVSFQGNALAAFAFNFKFPIPFSSSLKAILYNNDPTSTISAAYSSFALAMGGQLSTPLRLKTNVVADVASTYLPAFASYTNTQVQNGNLTFLNLTKPAIIAGFAYSPVTTYSPEANIVVYDPTLQGASPPTSPGIPPGPLFDFSGTEDFFGTAWSGNPNRPVQASPDLNISVTAATNANPGVFTGSAAQVGQLNNLDQVTFISMPGTWGTTLNGNNYKVWATSGTTFQIAPIATPFTFVDTTTFGAYTSGGLASRNGMVMQNAGTVIPSGSDFFYGQLIGNVNVCAYFVDKLSQMGGIKTKYSTVFRAEAGYRGNTFSGTFNPTYQVFYYIWN